MNKVRKLHDAWVKAKREDLEKLRTQYSHVFYEVFHMLPDNALIDFDSAIFHPEEIVAELEDLGINEFTISGGWSGAAETIAEFEMLGFKLMGLVYVASPSVNFESGERERVPAFLLKKKGAHKRRGVNYGC